MEEVYDFLYALWRYGQYHPLLRLLQPYLPVGKATVFEWYLFQVYLRPGVLPHLSHRRGQPTGPTVSNGVIQVFVPCHQEEVQEFLLRYGVANLYGAP